MRTELKNLYDRYRTAYEGADSALGCLCTAPNVTPAEAHDLEEAISQGAALAAEDFARYIRGELRPDDLTRSACRHFGFSNEMLSEADRLYKAVSPSFTTDGFTATDLVLRSMRKNESAPQPERLAAACYAALIDHENTADTLQTARTVGYCVGLQTAAAEHAAKTGACTDIETFFSENQELIDAISAVCVYLMIVAIVYGAVELLALKTLGAFIVYLLAVILALVGVISLEESIQNGAIRERLDNKAIAESSKETIGYILTRRALDRIEDEDAEDVISVN